MKTLTLSSILFMYSIAIFAQVPDYTLGLRFGGTVNAFGAEVSYQIGVSDETRLELDLGFGTNKGLTVFKGTAGYQWIGNLGGDFNWFGGPVIASGMYKLENPNKEGEKFDPFFHVGAVIGIDYFFDKQPFQVSADFRPEYPLGDSYADGDLDVGLGIGIRYILEW